MVPIPEGADTEEEPPAPSHNQVDSGQTISYAAGVGLNRNGSSNSSSGDASSSGDSTSTAGTSPPSTSSMTGSDLAAYYRRVADMLD